MSRSTHHDLAAVPSVTNQAAEPLLDVAIRCCRVFNLFVPFARAVGGSGATGVGVVLVELEDGDGYRGTGFTYTLGDGMAALIGLVKEVTGRHVVGTSPGLWPQTWERIRRATGRLGRGVVYPALSAVDIAIWDLRARRAAVPLHRYLGSVRARVPIYGSGRFTHAMSTDELVAGAAAYVDEGYTGVKLRVGVHGAARDLERVAAVREAVGDDVDIMVDANERLDFLQARRLGSGLAELGVLWLEEPLPASDLAGHAQLAKHSPVPIAVGEHLLGRHEFAAYLTQGAAAILMPDVPIVGGLTEALHVASTASALGAGVSPHFLPELHVHLGAVAPAVVSVEHFPLVDELLADTLDVVDGFVAPPARPGHGIAWDEAAVENFSVEPRSELSSSAI